MPIMTAYYLKSVIGSPFKLIARLLFLSHHSCTLWKHSVLHFVRLFFSSSLFLVPYPRLILDLHVVFSFENSDFEVSSDVELPRFFTLPLRLFVIFGLPTLIFGAFLQKKLVMGLLPNSASEFFYTCALFFFCFLIPPASDLLIVSLVLVASLCLVSMKNPCKTKASLKN